MGNDEDLEKEEIEKKFFSDSRIVANYDFLESIGVFEYVDNLAREIRNYKTLLTRGWIYLTVQPLMKYWTPLYGRFQTIFCPRSSLFSGNRFRTARTLPYGHTVTTSLWNWI